MDQFKRTGTGRSLIAPFSLAGEYGCTAANCRKKGFQISASRYAQEMQLPCYKQDYKQCNEDLEPQKIFISPRYIES